MSYAATWQKVKTNPKLTDFGGSVSHTEANTERDLMLDLSNASEKSVDCFRSQVEKVLGEQQATEVKARKQKIVTECQDLDQITSRKDICVALREEFSFHMP